MEKGNALLDAYQAAAIDFLNFHWYIPDAAALEEAVLFLRGRMRLPVLSNEVGQRDRSADSTRVLMAKLVKVKLPVVIWFSLDMPDGAQALMSPDGSLRPTGAAFQSFIRSLAGAGLSSPRPGDRGF